MSIEVTRSSMPPFEEYCAEIRDLWDSCWLTNMGDKHRQLENELKKHLGAENVTLFTNGHCALSAVLEAMDFPCGGEVITSPFTFVSTTHAIQQNGLKPVFCDIDPIDFTIDVNKIEALITEKTCAILPIHVYGNICNVHEIRRIADKHGLKVIYDAAHAFGEMFEGTGVGNFGDAAMFSFHATKVFHTAEGGAVTCGDDRLASTLGRLKNFGIINTEEVERIGGNAKMSELHAAMGLCNLRHIDEEIAKRKRVVEQYRMRFEGIAGLQLNPVQPEVRSNYAYFPVVISQEAFGADRDAVCAALAEEGIHARKYFYPLTSCLACYQDQYDASHDTPTALRISQQVLTLPLYAELAPDEVDRICNIVLRCRK